MTRPTAQSIALRSTLVLLLAAILVPAIVTAQGFRWPENPENLKAFPDSVKGSELGARMRHFATALGVRCQYCHVAKAGTDLNPSDLTTFDFPSDESANKEKARVMIAMVQAINGSHLAGLKVEASKRVEVTCATCHRGQPRPLMLEDLLAATIEQSGVESARDQYLELRAEHYGGYSFDFSAGVLSGLAEELAGEGKSDEAIAMLTLELEQHPEFAYGYFLRATVRFRSGDEGGARADAEKAVELASPSERPFFQSLLDKIPSPNGRW